MRTYKRLAVLNKCISWSQGGTEIHVNTTAYDKACVCKFLDCELCLMLSTDGQYSFKIRR